MTVPGLPLESWKAEMSYRDGLDNRIGAVCNCARRGGGSINFDFKLNVVIHTHRQLRLKQVMAKVPSSKSGCVLSSGHVARWPIWISIYSPWAKSIGRRPPNVSERRRSRRIIACFLWDRGRSWCTHSRYENNPKHYFHGVTEVH